jgi:O-antigen/teichoic acid export membrane protein
MLMRQTFLYLPAQVLGPLAQMAATVAWTYWLAPDALGAYALIWAIQEIAGLAALSWWSAFVLRYAVTLTDRRRFDAMECAVQALAALFQTAVAVLAVWFVLDLAPTPHFIAAAVAFTLTRNLGSHLADRARAHVEIAAFSIIQIVGSLVGFGFGIIAVTQFGASPEALLWAYAIAQGLAIVIAVPLMRLELAWPKFDPVLLAAAWRYGAPLVVASLLVWVGSQAIRFIVQFEYGVAAVGYVTVGWWLGQRLTTFAAMLVTGASFTIAVQKIHELGARGALPQFADNSALLLAILVPSVAGVMVLNVPLVENLVAAAYVPVTIDILPLAVAAGAIRTFKNHGSDQVFLLFERTTLNIWSTTIEAVAMIACCWIGLRLGGMHGAVMGCLAAAVIGQTFSFTVARLEFGYYVRLTDLARILMATGLMTGALLLLPLAHTLLGMLVEVLAGVVVYGLAMAILYPSHASAIFSKAGMRLARR